MANRKPITKECEHKVIYLYTNGWNQKEIYRETGVNQVRQREIYEKHGVEIRGRSERPKKLIYDDVVLEENGVKAIDCDKEGYRKCRFHSSRNVPWNCDYIGITGHSRGCDPKHCTKWEPKSRNKKSSCDKN